MPRYLLGLDAGSGSVRALLVDVESGRTAVAVRRWEHVPAGVGLGAGIPTRGEPACWWRRSGRPGARRRRTGRRRRNRRRLYAPQPGAGPGGGLLRRPQSGRPRGRRGERDGRRARRGGACGRTGWPAPVFMAPRLVWLARHHPQWLEGAVALTVGD
ncbi:MAG: hypothetical protein RMK65_08450, partial [Anaerolineae bacterium]|nr:hypothetical protein [Anaerolineae bacterium]